jgi:hypothetical protein
MIGWGILPQSSACIANGISGVEQRTYWAVLERKWLGLHELSIVEICRVVHGEIHVDIADSKNI